MDIFTFISKVIDSLAWPATIALGIFLVRKQLPEIARSLKSIKFKDFEMTFEREVREAAAEVKEALSAWDAASKPGFEFESVSSQHMTSVSHYSQSAAMLEAWLKVESAAADFAAKRHPNSAPKYPSPLKLKEILVKAGIFNNRQADAFDALRKIRNQLVHVVNVQFDEDTVAEYLASAETMARYIAEQTKTVP
jgi:uncharacterized protein YutE (UPF0331/DUF86 family)